ncbi:MAG: exopolysaccharide biosynthesis protein, partial [Alphaproteobacteria bacterium]
TLALVIMLPIPFIHGLPALTMAVFALALFNRDGILALVGYAMTGLSAWFLIFFGHKIALGIQSLIHFFGG